LHEQLALSPEVWRAAHFHTEMIEEKTWVGQFFPNLGEERGSPPAIEQRNSVDIRAQAAC
jgi:hypothetical protein